MKELNHNHSTSMWLDKHFEFIFRILMGCAGLTYILTNPFLRTGLFNDDAVYILTSQKLWAASQFFPELGIKPDYPMPGLPLLLAPFTKILAPHWDWLELVSGLATLSTIFFLKKLIQGWISSSELLLVLIFYAFNPVVAKFAGIIMPEPYYTLCCIASFYLVQLSLKSPQIKTGFFLGLFLGWGSMMRPEGILLLVSIVGVFAFAQVSKKVIWGAALAFALWGIVFTTWFFAHRSYGSEFAGDIQALIKFWSENGFGSFPFAGEILRVFFLDTLWSLRFVPLKTAESIVNGLMVIGVITFATGVRSFWNTPHVPRKLLLSMLLFCSAYFLIHIFWHVAATRYFLPLFPFVLLFAIRGSRVLSDVLSEGLEISTRWRKFVVASLLFLLAYEVGYVAYSARTSPNPMNARPQKALEWIKKNIDPTKKINTNIAPSIVLFTGLHARKGLNATNADLYYYLLMKFGVNYLVRRGGEAVTPGVGETENPNIRWVRKIRWLRLYPHRFPIVYEDNFEQVRICEVKQEPAFIKAFEKYIQAVTEFNAGQQMQALQSARDSTLLYREMGCAYNLMGVILIFQNQSKAAHSAFLIAQNLLPDSTFESLNLATLYHQEGNLRQAADYIKRGLNIAANNGEKEAYLENVRVLQEKWDVGRATLFIDSPDPRSYSENDI